MRDILQEGLIWLKSYSEEHFSQSVELSYPGRPGWKVPARTPSIDTTTLMEGERLVLQHFVFVIGTEHFQEPPARGLLITWNKAVFEIAFKGKAIWEFDDPYRLNYSIQTVFKHAC